MPRYGGVTVIDAPPTAAQALMGGLGRGLGQGLNAGIERAIREAENRKKMGNSVLQAIMTGEMDPRLLASGEGQAWLKSTGLDRDPNLSGVVRGAEGRNVPLNAQVAPMFPGPAGPPAAVNIPLPGPAPVANVQDQMRIEGARREMASKLAEAQLSRDIKVEDTVAANALKTSYPEFIRSVVPAIGWGKIKDVKVDEGGFVSWSLVTQDDIDKKRAEAQKLEGTWMDKYTNAQLRGSTARGRGVASLVRVLMPSASPQTTAQEITLLGQELGLVGPELLGISNIAMAPKMDPRAKAKALLPSMNRIVDSYNSQLKVYGKQAGLKPNEINEIPRLTLEELTGEEPTDERGGSLSGFVSGVMSTIKGLGKALIVPAEGDEDAVPARKVPLSEGVVNRPDSQAVAGRAEERVGNAARSITDEYEAMRREGYDVPFGWFVDGLKEKRDFFMKTHGLSEREYQAVLEWAERATQEK